MLVVLIIGIFVVGFIVYAVVRGTLRHEAADTRRRYNAAMTASRTAIAVDLSYYPSWIEDPIWSEQLSEETLRAALNAGLTAEKASELVFTESTVRSVFIIAAELEKAGFSRTEQIVGACDFVERLAVDSLSEQAPRNN